MINNAFCSHCILKCMLKYMLATTNNTMIVLWFHSGQIYFSQCKPLASKCSYFEFQVCPHCYKWRKNMWFLEKQSNSEICIDWTKHVGLVLLKIKVTWLSNMSNSVWRTFMSTRFYCGVSGLCAQPVYHNTFIYQ